MITRNYNPLLLVLLCSLICFSSCSRKITENGKASYYADKFEGRKTASGETYRKNGLTAAHRTLPFGTKVKVLNISNGKSVTVRINDRGPFSQGRVIDLSKKAAKRIGMLTTGVAVVEIKYKKKKK
ncbi:septal ring lytic transglycosylase RlpA family protein [Chitinophaga filiformis]|uniref:Probable endolytic peptidoglycan transglycosylase RlpA n=1 Tax=Chitinophaga filiformis TaxID=104663 RepID=A0ABY4I426_CHIFI|nr:septal ring lytic transglycosylase RlpA family protein [Chitinophaga filiformis]UPK70393.1 septal ring lytic transglycosylase RlpA family protein [Chitinophaga filiformis]